MRVNEQNKRRQSGNPATDSPARAIGHIGNRSHCRPTAPAPHDVAEAVALADRILLIEDGAISLDVSVDLPRPRERGTAAFAAFEDRVLKRVLRRPAAGRLAIPSIARIPVRR